jgi:hypothetical protein
VDFNDYDQFFFFLFSFWVENFDHFATKTRGRCEGAKGFFCKTKWTKVAIFRGEKFSSCHI